MSDIIWGNGNNIISKSSFQLDVTIEKMVIQKIS